ncbi:Protein of unknown function [Pyronema omphalodes CBS 100304]|uniref:Uncharacterized protein n=1 Tax=Pyronema omphalodes (strain CBS 100304) TaxID=1076935 RepID=U4LMY1_PYROM|nr:Protein of unknown function [Pyronema omphalodes CBS 100304]
MAIECSCIRAKEVDVDLAEEVIQVFERMYTGRRSTRWSSECLGAIRKIREDAGRSFTFRYLGQTSRCPVTRLWEDIRSTPSHYRGTRFTKLARLLKECDGLSSEASESSWKLFVFPELELLGSSEYKGIDTVERTIIAIRGAQTAGCLNMEAGGKFADFELHEQTQSLLKELPPLSSPTTELIPPTIREAATAQNNDEDEKLYDTYSSQSKQLQYQQQIPFIVHSPDQA